MDIANSTQVSTNGKNGTGGAELDKPAPETSANNPRRRWLLRIGALIAASLFGAAWAYCSNAAGYESTDDAFNDGHIVRLSAEVSGNLLSIYINDHQMAKRNDTVVELDPRDFQARVAQSRANVQAQAAALGEAKSPAADAQAALASAELDLSYTRIYAPASGRVTQRAVEVGDFQPGDTLFAIVRTDFRVIANFKETQFARIHPANP